MSWMRTELGRIAANYTRLIVGALCGLITVRVLIGYGVEVLSFYTLIVLGVGIGAMIRELTRIALLPLFAEAWRRQKAGERGAFGPVFASGHRFALAASIVGFMLMVAMATFAHRFDIGRIDLFHARVFILCRAAILLITVNMLPVATMLPLLGRFNAANAILLAERVIDLAAVGTVALVLTGIGTREVMGWFGAIDLALYALFFAWFYRREVGLTPDLRPRLAVYEPAIMRSILAGSLWAFLFVLSMNLFIRFDTLFINVRYGAAVTAAFGVAVQLIGMTRQITTGISNNLDAVIANQMHAAEGEDLTHRLMSLNAYLQSVFAGSTIAVIALVLDDLLRLWLGAAMDHAEFATAARVLTVLIMVGMAFRAFSESFVKALQAVGANRQMAVAVTLAALANLAALFLVQPDLLPGKPYAIVGFAFIACFFTTHFILIPIFYGRSFRVALSSLYAVPARPALAGAMGYVAGFALLEAMAPTSAIARIAAAAAAVGAVFTFEIGLKVRRELRETRTAPPSNGLNGEPLQ